MLAPQGTFGDNPIVDGFTYSMSQLMLPTVYRTQAMAQLETLRRSNRWQWKLYVAPFAAGSPTSASVITPAVPKILARSQAEYKISVADGCYIWGISFAFNDPQQDIGNEVFISVFDSCSEVPFFNDYATVITVLGQSTAAAFPTGAGPQLLANPRVIAAPGQVTVEIYNSSASDTQAQLTLHCAEPCMGGVSRNRPLRMGGK